MNRYIVFTREGNELFVLRSFESRVAATNYMKSQPEGTKLSLATLLILDATVRGPLRSRELNILDGGDRFITRNRPKKGTKEEGE